MQKFDLLGDHGYLCTKVMEENSKSIHNKLKTPHFLSVDLEFCTYKCANNLKEVVENIFPHTKIDHLFGDVKNQTIQNAAATGKKMRS